VESLEPPVVVSQGLLRACGIPTKRPQVSPLRYAPVEMTILLQLRFRISPGNSESHPQTALSSRPEESWACGRPKVIEKRFTGPHLVRHPLSMESLPFPCHPDRSEAERRDLRFRRPFVEMFFDRAQRIGEICGFFFWFSQPLCCPSRFSKAFPLTNFPCSTNVSRASLSKPRSREEGNCRW
jgi:hypothetical protein